MEVEQAIRSLRASRWYERRPVGAADLQAILDAGRRTGSGKNRQPWQLVVVRQRSRLEALAACGPWAGHLARAPLAIVIAVPREFGLIGLRPDHFMADTERVASLMAIFDAGRLAQSLMLAGWERGVGSCPATMHDQGRARAVLEMPETQWIAMSIAFGYPVAETAEQRDYATSIIAERGRRPLEDLVHHETWSPRARASVAPLGEQA
jgi:nitroreductase